MNKFFEYIEDIRGMTKFSNLLLLCRDIYTCFGINPNNRTDLIDSQAIWPGTMAIMVGIDLLAKLDSGEDSVSKSGERFKNFVRVYLDTEYDHSIEIYQLRNSLLHSFGLYGQDAKSNEFKFILVKNGREFVTKKSEINSYCISVSILHQKFESSIGRLCDQLDKLVDKSKLNYLIDKYGWTEIGQTGC